MNGEIVAEKLEGVINDLRMSDSDFAMQHHVSEMTAKEAKIFKTTNMLEIIAAELHAGAAAKKEREENERAHYKGLAFEQVPPANIPA